MANYLRGRSSDYFSADKWGMTRHDYILIAFIALLVGIGLLLVINEPGYTDAYYYYNAGERLATGKGLTDPYLVNYIYLPESLPFPSHTYWMPLTSLLIAASLKLFGIGFTVAQIPSLIAFIGLSLLSAWLGSVLGQKRIYGWLSALLVMGGGYYLSFWLTTDHFALYGLLGCSALITMGLGRRDGDWRWFIACGVLIGLAHLTRSDGALLGLVALIVVWQGNSALKRQARWRATLALALAYSVVMLPWIVRNLNVLGTLFPTGGARTALLRDYNEFFAYPADWSFEKFWAWGIGNILESRLQAGGINFLTWLAVEGMVLLGPLALWAWWRNRSNVLLLGFGWYVLLLHFVMTIIFPFAGYRGGLLHSSTALFPFWMALALLGLDDAIGALARLRNWPIGQAKTVFRTAAILLAVAIGLSRLQNVKMDGYAPDYIRLSERYLPSDAVLMVNSPPTWYYFLKQSGVTLPDTPLERVSEIASRYCITHLVLDVNVTESFSPLFEGSITPPDFLEEIIHLDRGTETLEDDIRIYQFNTSCQADNG